MEFRLEILVVVLRKIMAHKGLQAQEVALLAGMHPPALSRILSQRATPTLYNLQRILHALDTSMGVFFTQYDLEVAKSERKKALIRANHKLKANAQSLQRRNGHATLPLCAPSVNQS